MSLTKRVLSLNSYTNIYALELLEGRVFKGKGVLNKVGFEFKLTHTPMGAHAGSGLGFRLVLGVNLSYCKIMS
jgi:hypothetical protein